VPFGFEIITAKQFKKLKGQIQALEEGQRGDVLTTGITGATTTSESVVDRNNYRTYKDQVNKINEIYNNKKFYGGEFLRDVIDTRTSFIAGGGISIIGERKKTNKWIDDFFKSNKFYGSGLLDVVKLSEMEGKCLIVLFPDKKKDKIRIRYYSYYRSNYNVEVDENDNQKIKKVTYTKDEMSGEEVAKPEHLVYIKTGGSPDTVNLTPPKIANVLTDIENVSRAKYDLRKNNHLFAKIMPYFKCETRQEAQAINKAIASKEWQIGTGYAGTADFSMIGPPPGATEAITKEILLGSRNISRNTGIPIHWMAWPEVLSNRATAENLLEVTNSATIQERSRWIEGLTEMVIKAMEMATELGFKDSVFDPDGFELRLPLISYANLKQLQETWIPLQQGGYISEDTVRNIIPTINPSWEKKLIEKEKKENMERFQEQNDMEEFGRKNKEADEKENEDVQSPGKTK
jgi:hypothetical protein